MDEAVALWACGRWLSSICTRTTVRLPSEARQRRAQIFAASFWPETHIEGVPVQVRRDTVFAASAKIVGSSGIESQACAGFL